MTRPLFHFLVLLAMAWAAMAPARAQDLGESVWAWLPLSMDVRDHGPLGHAVRAHGAVADAPMQGPFTGAASFAGGWVEMPADHSPWGDFTLAAWVWFDDARGAFTPLLGRLGLHQTYGLSYATGAPGEPPALATDQVPQWRRWAHVALVHQAERRQLDLWINGWLSATLALPEGMDLPAPFGPGFGIGGGGQGRAFAGRLAEVLVLRRALGFDEIRDLSQGMGRQRPLQVAASQGCGGRNEPPCQVCVAYETWPPARWAQCGDATVAWCAAEPRADGRQACP